MAEQLEGKDVSLWIATTDATQYHALDTDTAIYDAAVVDGGISGVVTAYLLQKHGLKTVLVEKSRIVEWTTGGTTAKLISQHYLIYDYLIQRHGTQAALTYASATNFSTASFLKPSGMER